MEDEAMLKRFQQVAGGSFALRGVTKEHDVTTFLPYYLIAEVLVSAGGGSIEPPLRSLLESEPLLTKWLKTHLRDSWMAWLAILLLSPATRRQAYWQTYQMVFPARDNHQYAMRQMAMYVAETPVEKWYTIEGLKITESKDLYGNILIRHGSAIRQVAETTKLDFVEKWKTELLHTAKQLPNVPSLGFMKEERELEEWLYAFINVAFLLGKNNLADVLEFVEERARRQVPVTPRQMGIMMLLWGWLRGYRLANVFLDNAVERQRLAQQAMSLVVLETSPDNPLDTIFYSSTIGTLPHWHMYAPRLEQARETKTIVTSFNHGLNKNSHLTVEEKIQITGILRYSPALEPVYIDLR